MSDDAFPAAVRDVVRDELAGLSVCTFARATSVDHDRQRVTVELKNDPAWEARDVPLAGGLTGDGHGDVPGVTAGDEVLVVFTADDVGGMTDRRGPTPDAPRRDSHSDVIALALGAYTDSDAVPDHTPGDRVIAHESGATVRFGGPGEPDLTLEHPSGATVRLDSEFGADVESADPRASPDRTQGAIEVAHPSGAGVTVGNHGVALDPGDTDGRENAGGYGYQGYDAGQYGGGGRQQGVQSVRRQNDPWRTELVGDPERPEEGHRHLIPQSGGGYKLTGPPVPQREVFAWFCVDANYESLVNSDSPDLQDARGFFEAYRDWLEQATGSALDPRIFGPHVDTTTDWPYPEPVPTPAERDDFRPTAYGEGGYDAGLYGE